MFEHLSECMSVSKEARKRHSLDALGLELQTVVSFHLSCWEMNLGPLEECFEPLRHISSPPPQLYLFIMVLGFSVALAVLELAL